MGWLLPIELSAFAKSGDGGIASREVDMVADSLEKSSRCQHPFRQGIVLLLALGVYEFATAIGTAQERTPILAQQFQVDFKAITSKNPNWGFYGPHAEKFVKYGLDGLRITLPAGQDGTYPETGLATRTVLKGDFEITVRYEILAEPNQTEADDFHTRFTLSLALKPPHGAVTLSRRMHKPSGPRFFSWLSMPDNATGKPLEKSLLSTATAPKGRLRVARVANQVFYSASEDDANEFRALASFPVGQDDVEGVRLSAVKGGSKSALDVRVMDLQIRAEAIVKPPTASLPSVNSTPPTKQYAQEYHLSFKMGDAIPLGWQLEGPDVETSLRFEPLGARFTLATGWKGVRKPTGMKTTFGPKGDFEITMHFEILAEPLPVDAGSPVGTRISVGIVKDTPHGDTTTLARAVTTNAGRVAVPWANLWDENAGKMVPHTGNIKSITATKGRLRLVRSGADLYYGISDGFDGEFVFFKKHPFGAEDLREIRMIASTGTEKANLDARVTDLRVRADAIPNMPASPLLPSDPGAQPPQPPRKGWLAVALAIGLGIVFLAAMGFGGVYLLRRRNASTELAGFVSVVCPTCDKRLKVKVELAGKKVKCSQCGNAVSVKGGI